MKWAFALGILLFVVVTFVYAPYLHIKEFKKENKELREENEAFRKTPQAIPVALTVTNTTTDDEARSQVFGLQKQLSNTTAMLNREREKRLALDPRRKALASAEMTVSVNIASTNQVSNHWIDSGGYVAFATGNNSLMSGHSPDSFGQSIGTNQVKYYSVFKVPADNEMIGKPILDLTNAEYLQIEFFPMPTNRMINDGKVTVVLNGELRQTFNVPPQISQEKRIFIRQIQPAIEKWLIPEPE